MASGIWQRITRAAREETRYRHFKGYFFRFVVTDPFYVPPHKQDSTYTTVFVASTVEHWLECEIAQWICTISGHSTTELRPTFINS